MSDELEECTCGTVFNNERTYYDDYNKCPTCALARTLGYEVKYVRGDHYESDSLDWVKIVNHDDTCPFIGNPLRKCDCKGDEK